jgi:hypothetical protein
MKEGMILIHSVSGYERTLDPAGAHHAFDELYIDEDAPPETDGSSWWARFRRLPGKFRRPTQKQAAKNPEAGDE